MNSYEIFIGRSNSQKKKLYKHERQILKLKQALYLTNKEIEKRYRVLEKRDHIIAEMTRG